MEEKTVKKRNTKTLEKLHDAFVATILEKDMSKMNVKELSERAGIHRKTFYLHYSCIEELFEDELTKAIEDYYKEIDVLTTPFDYYDLTRVFFTFASRDTFTELLYCNPNYRDLCSELMYRAVQHNRAIDNPYAAYSPEMQNIINAFVTNASMVSFRQWVADGKKVPLADAIHVVGSLLEDGVTSIVSDKDR